MALGQTWGGGCGRTVWFFENRLTLTMAELRTNFMIKSWNLLEKTDRWGNVSTALEEMISW